MIQPQVNLTFTAGTATTRTVPGTTASTYDAIVPIVVSGSIVYQPKGTCRTVTKLFNETFNKSISQEKMHKYQPVLNFCPSPCQ